MRIRKGILVRPGPAAVIVLMALAATTAPAQDLPPEVLLLARVKTHLRQTGTEFVRLRALPARSPRRSYGLGDQCGPESIP